VNLDRFSQPMNWERKRKEHFVDELEEYKKRRDIELEEDEEEDDD
jgi:hypothetical protein